MEAKYIITDEEAMYMERYKGRFSKRLAEWAISMMEKKDKLSGKMAKIKPYSIEEVEEMVKPFRQHIGEESIYDAWYLANMCKADYLDSSIPDKEHVALYVKDTLCDPDGEPQMVLACFRAKCDVKRIPILWERMM
ncbi:MAG: hypothetical protein IJ588_08730 [Prevotella sp.]|nr:hypothetical protein [Prevotella sp.]